MLYGEGGFHRPGWDALDDQGPNRPSGVYVYGLVTGSRADAQADLAAMTRGPARAFDALPGFR